MSRRRKCQNRAVRKVVPFVDGVFQIPFNKPFIVGKELEYIAKAVGEGHLSGDGPYTKRCHQWLEGRLGCNKALLTHSCTGALEMAAMLCEVKAGDEVIMPSFTFVSTANAFVLRGAAPVFVDIRPDTLNIDETILSAAVTSRSKIVIPVHYAGVPCAMNEIMDIAGRHGMMVVEDAAQAFLSTYHGKYLGTIGHLGCLSFHETKNIISGEGGALIVNDAGLMERAEIVREKGTNRSKFSRGEIDKYTWMDIGSSYLPSELVGAFLYAQLEYAHKITTERCRMFRRYLDVLRPLEEEEFLRLPLVSEESSCNGHMFYIITRSVEERSELIQYLRVKHILSVFHYVPLHSSPAGRRFGRVSGTMAVTDSVSDRILRLPLYFGMTDDEIDTVAGSIGTFFHKFRK